MIDLHTYLLFISAVIVLVLAPGPDMAYMLTRTVVQGRRAGVLAAVGINTGGYVHVSASVVGLTAILASSAVAFTIIKWLGACYLVWIGVEVIVTKSGPINLESGEATALSGKTIFWQGFLSDVLNPKVAIFFLAFLPQFVDVNNQILSVTQQLLLLGITCCIVAISVNLILVYLAAAATAGLRRNQNLVKWMNKAAGLVFVALGLRLAREKF